MVQALVHRLRTHRWAIAQHFWTIMQPTPEASYFLGGAVGLLDATASPWSAAALLAMAGTMAAHNQATEIRAELMPAMGMSAERARVPFLLGADQGVGLAAAVRARRQLLAAHLLPAAVAVTAFLLCAAVLAGLTVWMVIAVVAAVVAAYATSPLVQWYMGSVLVTEAYAERDLEQGSSSSTAELQSRLQAIPRMALVVAPSFAMVLIVVLDPVLAPLTGAVLLGALLALPAAAFPILLVIERRLATRVASMGVEAWSSS